MTASRPRLLFVGAFPPDGARIVGGNVTACRGLMASSFSTLVEIDPVDSTQVSNPPPGFFVRFVLAARRLTVFIRRFERKKPDVVLLFIALGASVIEKGLYAWYSRLRGVPALSFPRGGRLIEQCAASAFTRFWVRAALAGSHSVLCQGEAWQLFAIRTLGFPVERAPIIPNWTASNTLLELRARRVARQENQPVRLLFLGWLDREKGALDLIDACAKLYPALPFTLDFVGEGNASEALRQRVRQGDMGARVKLHGWLPPSAVHTLFLECDVLVLPSWAEGLPNAMIEGMAAGLAVIASSVGNIPSVLEHGVSGLLVEPRNVEQLSAALKRLVADRGLLERIAARGHEVAKQRFAVEPAVAKLVDVIERAANRT